MIKQSATSISDFKFCVWLYHLKHNLHLRPVETPEVLRVGTNWHKCLEILTMEPGKDCPVSCYHFNDSPVCPVCENRGVVPNDLRMALIRHMDQAYANCPPSMDLTAWGVERTILLYSAIGWHWYWNNDLVETVAHEVPFDRGINSLYRRRGMIDRIIRHDGLLQLGEYKSTSKPIDPQSMYWDHLKLDSQLSMYLIEARHAQLAGRLEQYGIGASDPLISGMLYDVWHKPAIKPKKLTQGDSKKFMVDGEYFGEQFDLKTANTVPGVWDGKDLGLSINGTTAEITPGAEPKPTKKNPNPTRPFAIRETPEMFGARLLADIQANPEKHFARKSIARTDAELARFEQEFSNIARAMRIHTMRDLWWRDENRCNATYRCAFQPICYYNLDVSNGNVPDGFRKVR